MSNTITIELCTEDRARLDRLAEALDRLLPKCDACAKGVADAVASYVTQAQNQAAGEAETTPAPVTTTTEEKPAEAPQKAQEETPEQPTEESNDTKPDERPQEPAPEKKEAPTVTLAQIQKKVMKLAAGAGKDRKAKVREIVNAYAAKVSELPEDKWTEVWDKLAALESEG